MKIRTLLLIWLSAAALGAWLIYFGLSDWMNPMQVAEALDRNPFRPVFRMIFATVMLMLTLWTAVFVTKRFQTRI